MATAIGAFFGGVIGNALFGLGFSLTVVNFVTLTLVPALVTIGLGLAFTAISKRINKPKNSDGQQETRQPVPARIYPWGPGLRVGGPLAFEEARTGWLYKIVLVSSRRVGSFERFFLNNREVTLDESGFVLDEPYNGEFARIREHDGEDDQTTDSVLAAAFPEWTGNHRLRGVAYCVVAFRAPDDIEQFQAVFPSGVPEFSCETSGVVSYDPRLDSNNLGGSGTHNPEVNATWTINATGNSALAILDWLIHPDGYARPAAKIDMPSFMAFADLCDENVDTSETGGEPRYRTVSLISLNEPRKQVLARLLEACDAMLYTTADGKISIHGGEWIAPTITFDHDEGHIIEASFRTPDAIDRYNELAIQYYEPELAAEAEPDAWQDESIFETGFDGEIKSEPFDPHVPSFRQARRLAKIKISRENPEWLVDLRCNLFGMQAIGERVVNLVFPEMEIDGPFWVEGVQISEDMATVNVSLRSAVAASYDWSIDEEGEPPPIPPDLSGSFSLEGPVITLTVITGDAIEATWTPDPIPNRTYQAQYKEVDESVWLPMEVDTVNRDSALSDDGLPDGLYDVRVRVFAGSSSAVSDWSEASIVLSSTNYLVTEAGDILINEDGSAPQGIE